LVNKIIEATASLKLQLKLILIETHIPKQHYLF